VVFKPRKGYGSVNTTVIKNEDDLKSVISKNLMQILDSPLEMLVESFVNGQMYHIDGIVHNGEPKLIWPSQYVNTVVQFDTNKFIAGFTVSSTNPNLIRLQEFVKDSLLALDGPPCYSFHAEAWITPENELVFCEVASRTGGGGIPYQILEAFGVSMSKTSVQYQCNQPFTLETIDMPWNERVFLTDYLVGWIFIYPYLGIVKKLPDQLKIPEYILSYLPYVQEGHHYQSRKSCADAVCCVIVKGVTEEEITSNIHKANDWFNNNSEWIMNE